MLTDKEIISLVKEKGLISPFTQGKVSKTQDGLSCPSYGLSHIGYDVRLQPVFKRLKYKKAEESILSLVESSYEDEFKTIYTNRYILEPHEFILGVTKEYFKMPNDISGSLFAKSSLARLGLFLPPTIIEPGWEGELVVEIANLTSRPIELRDDVGIGQVIFFKLSTDPLTTYHGKYQKQRGVQTSLNNL